MSKAKQMAEDHIGEICDRKIYIFTEEEFAIFWSQICKEQRELCSLYAWDKWNPDEHRFIQDSVVNAPEPKIGD